MMDSGFLDPLDFSPSAMEIADNSLPRMNSFEQFQPSSSSINPNSSLSNSQDLTSNDFPFLDDFLIPNLEPMLNEQTNISSSPISTTQSAEASSQISSQISSPVQIKTEIEEVKQKEKTSNRRQSKRTRKTSSNLIESISISSPELDPNPKPTKRVKLEPEERQKRRREINRIAAQNSRDRKKMTITTLCEEVEQLKQEKKTNRFRNPTSGIPRK